MVLTNNAKKAFNRPLDETDYPTDGDVIKYDGNSGMFKCQPGGSVALALDDLTDTTITSPAPGEYLRKGAGDWTNTPIQAADLPTHNHTKSQITDFAHTHPQSDITNLTTDLAGKAASSHTHAQADITNLVTDLAGKAASSHTHNASDINAGTIATARLGSGTANSSTFLRGDQTWAAPPGGGASIPVQYTFIGQQAWTNKNSALQEFLNTNQRRLTIDMTNATQFRIIANLTVTGTASSVTGFQYSDDGGTTWRGLDNGISGSNSTVTISDNGAGSKVSAWTNLAAGAKADRLVRIAGSGGDGAADPAYSNISIQLK